jgi:hypothetical protein
MIRDSDVAEEERLRGQQRRHELLKARFVNRCNMWAKMLEALAVKMEAPDQHQSYEEIMESLRQVMERVNKTLGEYY